jgi:hypothetical protein
MTTINNAIWAYDKTNSLTDEQREGLFESIWQRWYNEDELRCDMLDEWMIYIKNETKGK